MSEEKSIEEIETDLSKACWSISQQSAAASLLQNMLDNSVNIGLELQVEQQVGLSSILESMHKELDEALKIIRHIEIPMKEAAV